MVSTIPKDFTRFLLAKFFAVRVDIANTYAYFFAAVSFDYPTPEN